MKNYITETEQFPNTATKKNVDTNCNDILFYNDTNGTVFLEGWPIPTGQTLSIAGNADEINVSKYQLSFGSSVGIVYVIRKKYVNK